MFAKIVVANRGAIAARIIRCLRTMGIASVAVYSEADAEAPYLEQADEVYALGAAPAAQSYLHQAALLQVVARSGADGLHPGYGFLAENAAFATRVTQAGCCFIGPSAQWIALMGDKVQARQAMQAHGLPVGASSAVLGEDFAAILLQAQQLGFPVMIKPANGGGGIGMFPAHDEAMLRHHVDKARRLARRSFGADQIYLEKLLSQPRHIEFQLLADRYGAVCHLFERDCSVQRRHQKVLEEAPAPTLERGRLERLGADIVAVLSRLGYDNIGTMEWLFQPEAGFNFLEMNTRLQVEHGVTEAITGIDLVAAQIRLAAGKALQAVLPDAVAIDGHAIEARIYAEDPQTFFPSPGPLTVFQPPIGEGIRVETGYRQGAVVTPYYDPLLAKVIVHAPSRLQAIDRLRQAVQGFAIQGVKTNQAFIGRVLQHEAFVDGTLHTGLTQQIVGR